MIYVNQAQKPHVSLIKRSSSQPHKVVLPTRQQIIMKKSSEDLRDKIKKFRNLSKCNIILFGPSGAGKSSLIRSFFSSLYQNQELPEQLCIKNLLHNEGTQHYHNFTLIRNTQVNVYTANNQIKLNNAEVNLIDTRGQILLNERENKQMEIMLQGKVKNLSVVQQRNYRYAYKLWEFWKQDAELFPDSILCQNQIIPTQVILVFDGSLDQVPNGQEEIQFYKQVLQYIKQKGYQNPFIVLTQLDKLEKKFKNIDSIELIDQRINSIVQALDIPRKSVFFLENYHGQGQQTDIDYYSLKLLYECMVESTKCQIKKDDCTIF